MNEGPTKRIIKSNTKLATVELSSFPPWGYPGATDIIIQANTNCINSKYLLPADIKIIHAFVTHAHV